MQTIDVESRQPWEVRLYKNAFKGGEPAGKSTLLEDINLRARSGESLGKLLGEIKVLLGDSERKEHNLSSDASAQLRDTNKPDMDSTLFGSLRSCFDRKITV